jgi:hypothetical protein
MGDVRQEGFACFEGGVVVGWDCEVNSGVGRGRRSFLRFEGRMLGVDIRYATR